MSIRSYLMCFLGIYNCNLDFLVYVNSVFMWVSLVGVDFNFLCKVFNRLFCGFFCKYNYRIWNDIFLRRYFCFNKGILEEKSFLIGRLMIL